jgi:hypothetical protein
LRSIRAISAMIAQRGKSPPTTTVEPRNRVGSQRHEVKTETGRADLDDLLLVEWWQDFVAPWPTQ